MEFNGSGLYNAVVIKGHTLKFAVGVACALMTAAVSAADIEKRFIVTSGIEHDSNPQMSETDKNPVWIFSLLPQLQLDVKDDLNRWYADIGLLILQHSNQKSVANQENPRLSMGWDRAYESGVFGLKAGYSETTARNAELNNTGTFSNSKNKQTTQTIGANWQHRIASRWSVLSDVNYTDVKYSEAGILDDYTIVAVKSKLSYENSEKLTSYALLGYSQYEPDQNKTTYLTRGVVGFDYQLSEEITISPRAGIYNLSGRQSESDWEAGLKAEYTTPKALHNITVARSIEDSGLGFRLVDSVRLGSQYSLTERDRIGIDYTFDQFKKDSDLNVSKLDAQSLGVFYSRSISEHWMAKAYVTHRELEFSDSNPKANVIGVTLVYDTLSF